jgi:hypothetical protein
VLKGSSVAGGARRPADGEPGIWRSRQQSAFSSLMRSISSVICLIVDSSIGQTPYSFLKVVNREQSEVLEAGIVSRSVGRFGHALPTLKHAISISVHVMPYMIPYYESGLLIKFRCTDCDWAYCIQNASSASVSPEENRKAKEQ